jgi:hypothetical protein
MDRKNLKEILNQKLKINRYSLYWVKWEDGKKSKLTYANKSFKIYL